MTKSELVEVMAGEGKISQIKGSIARSPMS